MQYDNPTCRSGKHVIRSPRDRRSNGQCAACSRDNEARYRRKLQDARRRLAAIESALAADL